MQDWTNWWDRSERIWLTSFEYAFKMHFVVRFEQWELCFALKECWTQKHLRKIAIDFLGTEQIPNFVQTLHYNNQRKTIFREVNSLVLKYLTLTVSKTGSLEFNHFFLHTYDINLCTSLFYFMIRIWIIYAKALYIDFLCGVMWFLKTCPIFLKEKRKYRKMNFIQIV